jgi:hypothetical protein
MKNELTEDQKKLKINGDKIILDFDNCDIKENNYDLDVTNRGFSNLDIARSGYKEKNIEQSTIVYYYKKGESLEKYVSQVFSLNSITLASHIIKDEIVLYVDRFDPSKYFFDFNFEVPH